MATIENAAIVVAAGRGERMGGGGPKQYRDLAGMPVLAWSLRALAAHPAVGSILTVIHLDDKDVYDQSVRAIFESGAGNLLPPVAGGATRQASVLAGLEALVAVAPRNVLIHDAARPFVSAVIVSRVLDAIEDGCGALPAVAVADTLKRADADGRVTETVARQNLHAAQTPQGFRFAEILAAHRAASLAGRTDLTDDAAVAELAGMSMRIVAGDPVNAKITTAHDLAEATRRAAAPDIRTGNGYDVHPLIPGDAVTLCGVRIPSDRSLRGHSDADAGLHALTDALLATIAAGDIGSHFPPSDPQWRGVSSDRFLAHAAALVKAAGGAITHLDVTLVCEAPKIAPHRDAMRARIAGIAGIDIGRVSVKATTNEGIGFIGRREGIAALATATAAFGVLPR
jgi:2-C-methyl-D-erythritol 4-phosphate cytidylyltransferase/2-C-methyl-D-erythritol 2,4-cyclodiphosphate synthase